MTRRGRADLLTLPPWCIDTVQLALLGDGMRVIQITGKVPGLTEAILDQIGDDGRLLVVEPDREVAEAISERFGRASLDVLSLEPSGTETFGQFDTLLASPVSMPDWPLPRWGEIAMRNLRPGGHFVVDLPAESLCELLAEAWSTSGGDPAALAAWSGPSDTELAAALRELGLRRVEGVVGTHLVRIESPRALADFAVACLGDPGDLAETLVLTLAERLHTNSAAEVIFRRTRVHGMR